MYRNIKKSSMIFRRKLKFAMLPMEAGDAEIQDRQDKNLTNS